MFRKTGCINSLKAKCPSEYDDTLYLTLDIDWACDDVLRDAIDLLEEADVYATWFVTHQTSLLERLRANSKFELGIHPNFNFLLNGDTSSGRTAEEVLDRILEIVPEAESVRSHSMTQSSILLEMFHQKGLQYDCNHFIPFQSGIPLSPWLHWNGLLKVPYCWEDDVACLYGDLKAYSSLRQCRGLKICDFHPIHIYLNTEDLRRYERSRAFHRDPLNLAKYRNTKKFGTRDVLKSLIGLH